MWFASTRNNFCIVLRDPVESLSVSAPRTHKSSAGKHAHVDGELGSSRVHKKGKTTANQRRKARKRALKAAMARGEVVAVAEGRRSGVHSRKRAASNGGNASAKRRKRR